MISCRRVKRWESIYTQLSSKLLLPPEKFSLDEFSEMISHPDFDAFAWESGYDLTDPCTNVVAELLCCRRYDLFEYSLKRFGKEIIYLAWENHTLMHLLVGSRQEKVILRFLELDVRSINMINTKQETPTTALAELFYSEYDTWVREERKKWNYTQKKATTTTTLLPTPISLQKVEFAKFLIQNGAKIFPSVLSCETTLRIFQYLRTQFNILLDFCFPGAIAELIQKYTKNILSDLFFETPDQHWEDLPIEQENRRLIFLELLLDTHFELPVRPIPIYFSQYSHASSRNKFKNNSRMKTWIKKIFRK